ncbi:hypothetical protein N7462_009016 [Penicillium macrosclerotiorum]|uniref:uncharacterized protein n=1 Tax=Penicillium macrosclerotiorum TaxID=303699 RepID=UPI002548BE64|nr:uncharacterized protein N7462_009016 [Penicillium macrosclerotiorum]KAJ5676119.1 hypothetical protein N7462_009016 [Penicillium macrosclerotiorum]
MASSRDQRVQRVASDVGRLRDHTNFGRWHSRLRRTLRALDDRYWPTLTGENRPSIEYEIQIPTNDSIRTTIATHNQIDAVSITPEQINAFLNESILQPNEALRTWRAINKELLPLLHATLGKEVQLQVHIDLAESATQAFEAIEIMFSTRAKQHVWSHWLSCTYTPRILAPDFIRRWHQALDELIYLLGNDAPSVKCQFCQFMAAVGEHPDMKAWVRESRLDIDDPQAMNKLVGEFRDYVMHRFPRGIPQDMNQKMRRMSQLPPGRSPGLL